MRAKIPGEDLVEPVVQERQSLLLVHHGLLQVEPLQDVDVESEEAPQGKALLEEVLHGQLGHLQRHQNGTPARVLIRATS